MIDIKANRLLIYIANNSECNAAHVLKVNSYQEGINRHLSIFRTTL